MLSSQRLEKAKTLTARHCRSMPGFGFCIFFAASDGRQQALMVHGRGADFDEAWNAGARALETGMRERGIADRWLRIDWAERVTEVAAAEFHARLKATRRYYFRQGVCFDRQLEQPFTEQELNANAILQDGVEADHSGLSQTNLQAYARVRFGTDVDAGPDRLLLLDTRGAFFDDTGDYLLIADGLGAGRRRIDRLSPDVVGGMVASAARYLSRQVDDRGLFTYGWYPCFDRQVPTYNFLRHAGTAYAMIEACELTRDPVVKAAIDRALKFLIQNRVPVLEDAGGNQFAMLVDTAREAKLGGNAVLVLALTKYCEVFGVRDVLPMAERLARGMERMQDPRTGRFVHVVNVPDLSVKEENRIVFYDGEAALALVRLYAATGNGRWLDMAEKAFSYFISAQHWRHHDHWLSYAVNEITLHRPSEDHYRFGVRNFRDRLDFIVNRETTYPTLLELIMAAQAMLERLGAVPSLSHLLDDVDPAQFRLALETRAHRMLDGYFWPEIAMYFRNPERILGTFFVRHAAFQARIDDVSHYVSGLVAYRKFMLRAAGAQDRAATPAR
jgi:hypothetical protein